MTLVGNNIFNSRPPKDPTFSAFPYYDIFSYNALGRHNRVALCQLDAFGHDVLTMAVTGAPLVRSSPGAHSHPSPPLAESGTKPLHFAKAA